MNITEIYTTIKAVIPAAILKKVLEKMVENGLENRKKKPLADALRTKTGGGNASSTVYYIFEEEPRTAYEQNETVAELESKREVRTSALLLLLIFLPSHLIS